MPAPILSVKDLTITRDSGGPILHKLSLDIAPGEVLVVRGPSGSGKSTLLKCIAELNLYQQGTITLDGKTAKQWGVPNWRIKAAYVPQRPSILPGTPLELLETIRGFAARKESAKEMQKHEVEKNDPLDLAEKWGIEKTMWTRNWETLSGGEAQRIALAVSVGIGGADVLLLDEPTSALDEETSRKVEDSLVGMLPPPQNGQPSDGVHRYDTGLKALVWITHSAEQAERVATRTFDVSPFRQ
ncbi:hypothetical protein IAR50_006071 [Cryptococcus sp. DSM 104548]